MVIAVAVAVPVVLGLSGDGGPFPSGHADAAPLVTVVDDCGATSARLGPESAAPEFLGLTLEEAPASTEIGGSMRPPTKAANARSCDGDTAGRSYRP